MLQVRTRKLQACMAVSIWPTDAERRDGDPRCGSPKGRIPYCVTRNGRQVSRHRFGHSRAGRTRRADIPAMRRFDLFEHVAERIHSALCEAAVFVQFQFGAQFVDMLFERTPSY